MNRQDLGLRNFSLILVAAWLGLAGTARADSSTPTTNNAAPPANNTQPKASSVPRQKDVPAFDPNTAAVIQKSQGTSSAALNTQVQGSAKVGVNSGTLQQVNQGTLTKGVKVGKNPGPTQRSINLGKGSGLTKVGVSPGPIQRGLKVGKNPGPVQKLNAGALRPSQDMNTNIQLKLQRTLDNKSKFQNTLSNVMKQNEDTQKGVAGNMK